VSTQRSLPTPATPDLLCTSDRGHHQATNDHSSQQGSSKVHKTDPRALVVVETSYTRLAQTVVTMLESVRYKHRLQVTSLVSEGKVLPSLTRADRGRFAVIVFERLETYLGLDSWNRQLLDKYCRDYEVGIVAFAQPDDMLYDAQVKDFPLFIHSKLSLTDYSVSSETQVARIARTDKTFSGRIPGSSWTVFVGNHSTYQAVARARLGHSVPNDNNKLSTEIFQVDSEVTPVLLDRGLYDGVRRIYFGSGFEFWLHRVLFFDALSFLSHGQLIQMLDRFILVDVDDIFVGRTGVRMTEEDVKAMVETQTQLQNYVEGFHFNLGFSGKFFHHGSEQENEGDDALIANRDQFWWFGHSYSHTKAHHFSSLSAIMDDMLHNQDFAHLHGISVNNSYAVAPHHAGVYPVHSELYKAWRQVWGVQVTSTEEYPHLRPARYRRGFIHDGIMVLPRQTCMLFTHTMFFDKFPGGRQRLDHSIYGGELFQTILYNRVSVFMTHMTNFGNDRLALYTFESVVKFISCWTNLKLKTRPPLELANYYFQLYPDETDPVWSNPCDDRRHLEIWSEKKSCNRLPDFLVIGPQKTGTTALYTFLAMHPSILSNRLSETTFEEVQFFNSNDNYVRGLDWYLDHFPAAVLNGSLLFEKSAAYFNSEPAPSRVSALLPRVKLICILLHPAQRAYSWYQHMRSHNDRTALSHSFFDVVNASSQAPKSLRELRRHCVNPGLYAHHLQRWLDYYDISQLYIVDGEMLRSNPVATMHQVQKFLGVQTVIDYSQLLRYNPRKGFYCQVLQQHSNTNSRTNSIKCLGSGKGRNYPPMDGKSTTLLKSFYRKPNIMLSELLAKLGLGEPDWLRQELTDS